MRAHLDLGTREGEICIGYFSERLFEAILWESKRQDLTKAAAGRNRGLPMFPVYVERLEVVEAGFEIVEPGERSPAEDENSEDSVLSESPQNPHKRF